MRRLGPSGGQLHYSGSFWPVCSRIARPGGREQSSSLPRPLGVEAASPHTSYKLFVR
jgi:hypothetical protein